VNNDHNISEDMIEAFEATEYNLQMINFKEIYLKIVAALPPRNSSFSKLSLENIIGCEVVCAAICHQINWDFLRTVIYNKTMQDETWITPKNLAKITSTKVLQLLAGYDKPERIREKERCSLLRSLGKSLLGLGYGYSDIFFERDFVVRNSEDIISVLNFSKAFSGDPEGKKIQLLLQNLSDYSELTFQYCHIHMIQILNMSFYVFGLWPSCSPTYCQKTLEQSFGVWRFRVIATPLYYVH